MPAKLDPLTTVLHTCWTKAQDLISHSSRNANPVNICTLFRLRHLFMFVILNRHLILQELLNLGTLILKTRKAESIPCVNDTRKIGSTKPRRATN